MSGATSLASQLNEHIRIEKPVNVADNAGGFASTWQSHKSIFAKVTPQGHSEANAGQAEILRERFAITIRPDSSLTLQMRIIWGGKTLLIRRIETHKNYHVITTESEVRQ